MPKCRGQVFDVLVPWRVGRRWKVPRFFFGRTDVEKSPEFSWNYQDYLRNTIHKNVENHMFFRSDNKFSTNGGENHICLVSLQEGHEKL